MIKAKKKAGIIGAGLGGIATAIRLARLGLEVHVFEANEYPGGKLSTFQLGDFRFDAGPSLFTMPHLVEELFWLCGKKPSEIFRYKTLEESCRYFFQDGTKITFSANREQMLQDCENILGEKPEVVSLYLKNAAFKYQSVGSIFMEKPLHSVSTWLSIRALKAYFNIFRFDIFSSMNAVNQAHFSNPKTVQIFNRYATYNGSNPYQAPGMLTMIPHLELNQGAFLPEGGMVSITNSLVKLAKNEGVIFHFKAKVNSILYKDKVVNGLVVDSETHDFDTLVSNQDVSKTFRHLLPQIKIKERILNQPKSSSALVFYWGVSKTFEELGLHNIFFSNDYSTEQNSIFKKLLPAEDSTIYINVTSKHILTDAPIGKENWFVMVNVPAHSNQNWTELVPKVRKNVIQRLNKELNVNLESLIEVEEILDPVLIEQKTGSDRGALYGNSSNNKFAAFLRYPNQSPQLNGLYFCGGSVHPGGGIPLVLNSARIVEKEVRRYFKM